MYVSGILNTTVSFFYKPSCQTVLYEPNEISGMAEHSGMSL